MTAESPKRTSFHCSGILIVALTGGLAGCSSGGSLDADAWGDAGNGGGGDVGDAGGVTLPPGPGTGTDAGKGSATPDSGKGAGPDSSAPLANCPPSWTPSAGCGAGSNGPAPDFGSHVLIFDPTMTDTQDKLNSVYQQMDADQFDNNGYAYLFKPGKYNLDVQIGFYTHVIGLGMSPDDVTITGAVRAKADWLGNNNATCNFWRTAENLAVVPTQDIDNGTDIWATSQGTSLRRIHVMGSINLSDNGWSSGGFIGDSKIDSQINSGSQQQYLTRNVDLSNWSGANWNMVFVGDGQPPSGDWPQPPYTVVDSTPVVREKPFLYLDDSGNYLVMVPALKKSAKGSSWGNDPAGSPVAPGSPLSIDLFYVAKPGDTSDTINAALAAGKNLLLTPGDYALDAPIQVTRPGTVVFGMGLPVLTPNGSNPVLTVADVDGVTLAGLLVEAGPAGTKTLVQIGDDGSTADHSSAPTMLFDVNCRIGGNILGKANICLTVNSNDVIVENSWLWRADHAKDGINNGWGQNDSNSGIVVNGNDVTAYALFSEHHQQYQTLWNGNGGAVYFYQSEMPYDPPNQGAWMSSSNENGYPSYKVADSVMTHTGTGIGVYAFFQSNVYADNAIETPSGQGVAMSHMMTYGSGTGGINNIINGNGGSATAYSNY